SASGDAKDEMLNMLESELSTTRTRIAELEQATRSNDAAARDDAARRIAELTQRERVLNEELERLGSANELLEMERRKLVALLEAETAISIVDDELDEKYSELQQRFEALQREDEARRDEL